MIRARAEPVLDRQSVVPSSMDSCFQPQTSFWRIALDRRRSRLSALAATAGAVSIMLERQREGIRKAQAAGKYLGRKPSAFAKGRRGDRHGVAATARAFGIGRGSVYRALDAGGVRAAPDGRKSA